MNTLKRLFVCACMTLALSEHALSKGWNGITPFHSTLADVVRKFGPCDAKSKTLCVYKWKPETVTFVFLSGSCGTGKKRLPSRTIIRIERTPKRLTHLPDYHKVDPFSYQYSSFSPRENNQIHIENYIDDEEGFAAEAREGVVTQVFYTAKAPEIASCADSYLKPSSLLPRYDGAIRWEFFCPTITVSCPDKTVDVGEPITFSANWSSFPYMQPTLTWTISAGTIARGQGTSTLKVITKGLPTDTKITAMLTMGGVSAACQRQASCTSRIHSPRDP